MKQKKILIPTTDFESWKGFLADKNKHWKVGYSAMSTAISWEKSGDLPLEIRKVISEDAKFKEIELLLAIPEYKVDLPGGNKPSQNDIFAVCTTKESLTVVVVEGKAKENFDIKLSEWKKLRSTLALEKRLQFLLEKIGIIDENIDDLRYQLFHRLASSVIMAEKFHAPNAIMIIQSFTEDDKKNHFNDFVNFMNLFNIPIVEKGKLYQLPVQGQITIYAAWVYCKCDN